MPEDPSQTEPPPGGSDRHRPGASQTLIGPGRAGQACSRHGRGARRASTVARDSPRIVGERRGGTQSRTARSTVSGASANGLPIFVPLIRSLDGHRRREDRELGLLVALAAQDLVGLVDSSLTPSASHGSARSAPSGPPCPASPSSPGRRRSRAGPPCRHGTPRPGRGSRPGSRSTSGSSSALSLRSPSARYSSAREARCGAGGGRCLDRVAAVRPGLAKTRASSRDSHRPGSAGSSPG